MVAPTLAFCIMSGVLDETVESVLATNEADIKQSAVKLARKRDCEGSQWEIDQSWLQPLSNRNLIEACCIFLAVSS